MPSPFARQRDTMDCGKRMKMGEAATRQGDGGNG
jgi:hypothetical protein